jgi:hypothetical protein
MNDDWADDEIDWADEETDNPLRADDRNFYKVEKWTKDGTKVDRLPYADNNLEKARDLFASAIKHRPRIRLTIRRGTRVLFQWPEEGPAPSRGRPGGSPPTPELAALSRRGRAA